MKPEPEKKKDSDQEKVGEDQPRKIGVLQGLYPLFSPLLQAKTHAVSHAIRRHTKIKQAKNLVNLSKEQQIRMLAYYCDKSQDILTDKNSLTNWKSILEKFIQDETTSPKPRLLGICLLAILARDHPFAEDAAFQSADLIKLLRQSLSENIILDACFTYGALSLLAKACQLPALYTYSYQQFCRIADEGNIAIASPTNTIVYHAAFLADLMREFQAIKPNHVRMKETFYELFTYLQGHLPDTFLSGIISEHIKAITPLRNYREFFKAIDLNMLTGLWEAASTSDKEAFIGALIEHIPGEMAQPLMYEEPENIRVQKLGKAWRICAEIGGKLTAAQANQIIARLFLPKNIQYCAYKDIKTSTINEFLTTEHANAIADRMMSDTSLMAGYVRQNVESRLHYNILKPIAEKLSPEKRNQLFIFIKETLDDPALDYETYEYSGDDDFSYWMYGYEMGLALYDQLDPTQQKEFNNLILRYLNFNVDLIGRARSYEHFATEILCLERLMGACINYLSPDELNSCFKSFTHIYAATGETEQTIKRLWGRIIPAEQEKFIEVALTDLIAKKGGENPNKVKLLTMLSGHLNDDQRLTLFDQLLRPGADVVNVRDFEKQCVEELADLLNQCWRRLPKEHRLPIIQQHLNQALLGFNRNNPATVIPLLVMNNLIEKIADSCTVDEANEIEKCLSEFIRSSDTPEFAESFRKDCLNKLIALSPYAEKLSAFNSFFTEKLVTPAFWAQPLDAAEAAYAIKNIVKYKNDITPDNARFLLQHLNNKISGLSHYTDVDMPANDEALDELRGEMKDWSRALVILAHKLPTEEVNNEIEWLKDFARPMSNYDDTELPMPECAYIEIIHTLALLGDMTLPDEVKVSNDTIALPNLFHPINENPFFSGLRQFKLNGPQPFSLESLREIIDADDEPRVDRRALAYTYAYTSIDMATSEEACEEIKQALHSNQDSLTIMRQPTLNPSLSAAAVPTTVAADVEGTDWTALMNALDTKIASFKQSTSTASPKR